MILYSAYILNVLHSSDQADGVQAMESMKISLDAALTDIEDDVIRNMEKLWHTPKEMVRLR